MTFDPYQALRDHPHWTMTWGSLPAGECGRWYDEHRTVVFDKRLTQAGRRSTVAHEVVHAEMGDVCCKADGPDGPRIARRREQTADQIAARRLITLDALADALLWSQDEYEVADELWVDVETIRARLASLTETEKDYIDRRVRAAESRMP